MSKDKIKQKEYNKKYYEGYREEIKEKAGKRAKVWRKNHLEYINKQQRENRVKEQNETGKTKNSMYSKRVRDRLKKLIFEAYGNKCQCCGEAELEFLTIDHINNDGAAHRRTLKRGGGDLYRWLRDNDFPSEFQILCCNCNWSKRLGGGVCIHKRKEQEKTE